MLRPTTEFLHKAEIEYWHVVEVNDAEEDDGIDDFKTFFFIDPKEAHAFAAKNSGSVRTVPIAVFSPGIGIVLGDVVMTTAEQERIESIAANKLTAEELHALGIDR